MYTTNQVLFSNMEMKQQKSVVQQRTCTSDKVKLQSLHDTGNTFRKDVVNNPDDDFDPKYIYIPIRKLTDDSNQVMKWNHRPTN